MSLLSRNLIRGFSPLKFRNFHLSSSNRSALEKLEFHFSGYNKYGLYHDDLLNPEFCPIVAEAFKRLPEKLQMERTYRCIRAHQLEVNNSILPKEEWTKYEDENHFYLQPYMEEVKKEFEEILDWESHK